MSNQLIEPHGGTLVNRRLEGDELQSAKDRAESLPRVTLSERNLADLVCLATGVYSPLEGFVSEADYRNIVDDMKLTSGVAWSIPITLQAEDDSVSVGQEIALVGPSGDILALMDVTDTYQPDQKYEAEQVYGTSDSAHPGVQAIMEVGAVYLGGPISLIHDLPESEFQEVSFTPQETRKAFAERGWNTVVAFQTRNPIHRAHEYLTKVALEIVDGLFINPLVGTTKSDDIPADVRMRCYNVILDDYYPDGRVFLGTYPAAMRYAGPREAILHAISRQNYGCTHFIVGRDHAGVGDYYGTYDAQKIFEGFTEDELKISTLNFEHSFYCKKCEQMGSSKTCPHGAQDRVFLSGTKVREMLSNGQMPPAEFSRPEVAKILMKSYQEA